MFSGGLRGEILGDSMDEEGRRGRGGGEERERGRFKEGFWEEGEGFSGRRVV